jgi:hypothetical protein
MANYPDPFEPWRPRSRPTPAKPSFPLEPFPEVKDVRKNAIQRQPFLIVMTLALLFGGGSFSVHLGGQHFPRVIATIAVGWLGVVLAVVLTSRSKFVRLGIVLAGLAGAVGCWLVVPTSGGINWIEANRRLNELRTIPTGEMSRFTVTHTECRELAQEFPEMSQEIHQLEWDWLHRTTAIELNRAEEECKTDPRAATRRLREHLRALAETSYYHEFSTALQNGRRAAFDSILATEETRFADLVGKGNYAAINKEMEILLPELTAEAQSIDCQDRLQAWFLRVGERVMRGHLDSARRTLERLVERKEYSAVEVEGKRLSDHLVQLGTRFDRANEVRQTLDPLRRKALVARLDQAREESRRLLSRDQYEALGELGEKTFRELQAEAQFVGVEKEVTRFRDSCRVLADLARKAKAD